MAMIILTFAYSKVAKSKNNSGKTLPMAMPAKIHSATQIVRYLSNTVIIDSGRLTLIFGTGELVQSLINWKYKFVFNPYLRNCAVLVSSVVLFTIFPPNIKIY